MNNYNIYCDGYFWKSTDDIVVAVKECKNMISSGIEKEAISVWNNDGHLISLQF